MTLAVLMSLAFGRSAMAPKRLICNMSRTTRPRLWSTPSSLVATSSEGFTVTKTFQIQRQTLVQAASLGILITQQSVLAIFMRMSRIADHSQTALYVSSTAVVMVELIKLFISILLFAQTDSPSFRNVIEDIRHGRNIRFGIPAGLYVVQNNMQYIALTYLPAQIYQIFSQLKIICAALFSQKLLDKKHTDSQWGSIISMTTGIVLVQLSLTRAPSTETSMVAVSSMIYLGLPAVILASLTSGLAGAYSERLVKKSPQNLWDLNIQMSLYGLILALVATLRDLPVILRNGSFFGGYSPIVWVTILLHALVGLVTAFVVKNTSAVIKGFAQSGSVILSCILSHFLLHDFVFSKLFIVGSVIVCSSAVAFAASGSPPPPPPAASAALHHKKLTRDK